MKLVCHQLVCHSQFMMILAVLVAVFTSSTTAISWTDDFVSYNATIWKQKQCSTHGNLTIYSTTQLQYNAVPKEGGVAFRLQPKPTGICSGACSDCLSVSGALVTWQKYGGTSSSSGGSSSGTDSVSFRTRAQHDPATGAFVSVADYYFGIVDDNDGIAVNLAFSTLSGADQIKFSMDNSSDMEVAYVYLPLGFDATKTHHDYTIQRDVALQRVSLLVDGQLLHSFTGADVPLVPLNVYVLLRTAEPHDPVFPETVAELLAVSVHDEGM
eukprot:TRINITY_DN15098_c0_g1_i1.p1 TRINITY_DN15098_c0_g1~~TRINITY_DN15098_c0_g1_i1.p1  ORF type:complete len:269 (-),score=61.08 TRINITY_DN15098_c0_g1_i1:78-884(-)